MTALHPDIISNGKRHTRKRKMVLRAAVLIAAGIAAAALAMLCADLRVEASASGRVYHSIEDVPAREFGLLPGTSRLVKGKYRNDYFYKRVRAAAELYRAGKIRRIIVSGDNSRTDYNETGDMKRELAAEGEN